MNSMKWWKRAGKENSREEEDEWAMEWIREQQHAGWLKGIHYQI
jgi:hypothetical protein